MKQIGEFANDNQVTVKALHHYEKLGLLIPGKVDEFSGYRYYEDAQSDVLKLITFLKSLGFSLSEVKSLLDAKTDKAYFKNMLYARKKQAEIDSNTAESKFKRIAALLDNLDCLSENFDIREIMSMATKKTKEETKQYELFNYLSRVSFEHAVETSRPLCVMCVDIDRFKRINDEFGHDIGDIVIDQVVNTAQNAFNYIDPQNKLESKLIAREYGDEFKIMISIGVKRCEEFARHVIEEVKAIDFGDVADGLNTSVSIGIASIDTESESMGKLFHFAETALYEVKSTQKGSFLVYSE